MKAVSIKALERITFKYKLNYFFFNLNLTLNTRSIIQSVTLVEVGKMLESPLSNNDPNRDFLLELFFFGDLSHANFDLDKKWKVKRFCWKSF